MSRIVQRSQQALRRYLRAEDANMITLGLIFFILILMVAGISVDLMRYEQRRVQIQSLADRAVLAAASLTQPRDIEDVVRGYFEREGMLQYLKAVEVSPPSLNERDVRIVTQASVPALFTRFIGLDRIGSDVVSRAVDRVTDVEVVMVLDLSNSMNSFNRIENLRIAGVQFINTLYNQSEEDRVSVSIVNYTGQVNVGHQLLDYYTSTHRQPYSACVNFEGPAYSQLNLSRVAPLTGTGHFDPWHMHRHTFMAFCPTHPGGVRGKMTQAQLNNYLATNNLTLDDLEPEHVDTAEIMVMQDDPDVLRRRLRSLIADGNTSIEIGMKWAAALMDPGASDIVNDYINQNLVNAAFDIRPFEYENRDAIKAIVLMTDGENWDEWRMANQFKQGPSGVWHSFPRPGNANTIINQLLAQGANGAAFQWPGKPSAKPNDSHLSVRNPAPGWNQGDFFIPDRVENPMNKTWSPNPSRFDGSCVEYGPNHISANRRTPFRFYACNNWIIQELDHRELWATFSVRWVGAYLYHYPGIRNYNTFINERLSIITPATKNQRLYEICDKLRDAGVRVYAVAFEAPPNGVEAMRRCAYTPNYFFDVQGLQIEQAFRTIASSIQQLRLTE